MKSDVDLMIAKAFILYNEIFQILSTSGYDESMEHRAMKKSFSFDKFYQ